jgi:hypothetical protein
MKHRKVFLINLQSSYFIFLNKIVFFSITRVRTHTQNLYPKIKGNT